MSPHETGFEKATLTRWQQIPTPSKISELRPTHRRAAARSGIERKGTADGTPAAPVPDLYSDRGAADFPSIGSGAPPPPLRARVLAALYSGHALWRRTPPGEERVVALVVVHEEKERPVYVELEGLGRVKSGSY